MKTRTLIVRSFILMIVIVITVAAYAELTSPKLKEYRIESIVIYAYQSFTDINEAIQDASMPTSQKL